MEREFSLLSVCPKRQTFSSTAQKHNAALYQYSHAANGTNSQHVAAALSQNGFHTLLKLGQQHSRHKCLYCSAETAAVYTDRSPAAQHCRADCKGNGDGLVFRCGGRVDVLQQAIGRLSGVLYQVQERLEIAPIQCIRFALYPSVLPIKVHRTEHCTVAAGFPQFRNQSRFSTFDS